MPLNIALQMDPLATINPRTDTTLLLGVEAQRRGHVVFSYAPSRLSLHDGRPVAQARRVRLSLDERAWFTEEEEEALPLDAVDVVLLRQDPPFDMHYISSTYMLERAGPRTLVLNDPASVRNHPEKLFPLEFTEFTPPSLISADPARILAFHASHQDIVIKPLYGHGGRAVFRIREQGENLNALLETLFAGGGEPVVVQPFLPDVATGDRRMIVIDGKVSAVMGRIPAEGEIRANFRVGGSPKAVEMTPRQRQVGEAVGEVLRARGILLAGLDFIGDWLTEINITSPTGLRQLNALYGLQLERDFWDAAEARLTQRRA